MNEDDAASTLKRSRASDLARHILPSSGTMIGICATLIGLVKILEGQTGPTYADECGAIIALIFLFSAIFSYLAIRTVIRAQVSHMFERIADLSFLLGLTCIAIVVALWTFEKL
ncbi:MAG: putative rane protein [Hyphomicrobiales bacterium]|nr:putative rane protein [Hyphomicrobiales bacterium]